MKRKIKKLLDYCKSHEEKVFNAMFNSSMIIGAVIFGLIAFKYNEPKKMTSSDVEYCKERIEKISKNEFWESVEIINQLEKKGYRVWIDYENSKITIDHVHGNSEMVIFQKIKNEDISLKKDLSDAKNNQIIDTILAGVVGVIVSPVVIIIILAIFFVICYIIEWIQKNAEKIKK